MAVALLAWELGGGYGHVAPLRKIGRLLRDQGHVCVYALRDLAVAEESLTPDDGIVMQAPQRLGPPLRPVKTQLSYASLLHNIGFDDAIGLAGRLRAWRELMQRYGCQLVFAHHAPLALIAAHSLGLPAVALGTGFVLPPATSPFPSWETATLPADFLKRNETIVLSRLNAALERLRLAPLPSLQAIFTHARQALLTYPELDAYGPRARGPRSAEYLGTFDTANGARPTWPAAPAPRLVAYLRPFAQLPALMEALKRSRAHVLLRIADTPASRLASYQRPGMVITDQAVHLRFAAETCDAFLNYGAHGTVAEMLLAGKPGLLIPQTVEQLLTTRRAEALGAAHGRSAEDASDWRAALECLMNEPKPHAAARRFASRHGGDPRTGTVARVARMGLEQLRT